ncbi:MAG: OmpA family protein [Pseudomonadota bacterium]
MKSSRSLATLSATALATFVGPLAHAQTDDSGWYLGGNIGSARAEIDNARIASGLLAAGFTASSIDDDDTHLGYKLLTGYDFNRHFALEGGYFNLGRFGFTATTAPAGTLVANMKTYGLNLDGLGFLPFTDHVSAFGRVGVNYAETKLGFRGTGAVNVLNPNRRERAANYKFGAGLQYNFTRPFALRLEGERYRVNDAAGNKGDIDLFSVGLLYKPGREVAAPVVAPPPPQPPVAVVVTPPPPPPPVAPPPPRTQRYCSILELQFEINKDSIQRDDLEKLRVFATFMKMYPANKAVIEGNTDDVGTDEANLRLSQRRAEGVMRYLIANYQIPASQLSAIGYGESRPIADNRTDAGKRQNRRTEAVIACATDVEGLTVKPARMTMALQIEFDQNKDEVKAQYREDLREVADFLKANPTVTATVEGHTGNLQATPTLAMEISQRRAQNVVSYLVDNFGIARSRLSASGFGGSRPDAYNSSLAGQQDNRRVNVIINYPR